MILRRCYHIKIYTNMYFEISLLKRSSLIIFILFQCIWHVNICKKIKYKWLIIAFMCNFQLLTFFYHYYVRPHLHFSLLIQIFMLSLQPILIFLLGFIIRKNRLYPLRSILELNGLSEIKQSVTLSHFTDYKHYKS